MFIMISLEYNFLFNQFHALKQKENSIISNKELGQIPYLSILLTFTFILRFKGQTHSDILENSAYIFINLFPSQFWMGPHGGAAIST